MTILDLLQQGTAPEPLALAIAVSLYIATIPVLGVTTLLCTAAAVLLRLNMVIVQLINALAWPLQLLLIIPFYRLGALVFHDTSFQLSLDQLQAMVKENPWNATVSLFGAGLRAVAVWSVVNAVVCIGIYFASLVLLRRILEKQKAQAGGLATGAGPSGSE